MQGSAVDYNAVLEDLEQKRAAMNTRFDAAIAAIRQVLALEGVEHQPALPGIEPAVNAESRPGRRSVSLNGMGIVEASFAQLDLVGRHVPNPELARMLEAGGFRHRSQNFTNTLNSVLQRRAREVGDIVKTKQGWGRPEWTKNVAVSDSAKQH